MHYLKELWMNVFWASIDGRYKIECKYFYKCDDRASKCMTCHNNRYEEPIKKVKRTSWYDEF